MGHKTPKIYDAIKLHLKSSIMLTSIRKGLMFMIPFLLAGSFSLIVISFPIPAYQNLMFSTFGEQWKTFFQLVINATFGILSIMLVLTISYSYISEITSKLNLSINPLIGSVLSLSCYLTIIGIADPTFTVNRVGTTGIFLAILSTCFSAYLFVRLSKIKILSLSSRTFGATRTFFEAISAIYPVGLTILPFAIVSSFLINYGYDDFNYLITHTLYLFFKSFGDTLVGGILFMFSIHFFWFFGLHGNNMLESVSQEVFVHAQKLNELLVLGGSQPTRILTKPFFDTFVLLGGAGATLSLVVAIFLFSKHHNMKNHANMALIPSIFNINELLTFGIPIIFDPIFLFPFIFLPIILTITSYFAIYFNLVPMTTASVEWTTPIFLSGYLTTRSITGSLLQLFNLSLGVLIYTPFLKYKERMTYENNLKNYQTLLTEFKLWEQRSEKSQFLHRNDDLGSTAKTLVSDLHHDLNKGVLEIYYQPQLDISGKIIGVEALLRWYHVIYGFIYPPLIIALAEESNMMDLLGAWIIDKSFEDLDQIVTDTSYMFPMSINLSVSQLQSAELITTIQKAKEKYSFDSTLIALEITENSALSGNKNIKSNLYALTQLGYVLHMDDFGMGHSSLLYLKDHTFDTLKLDGSLVRDILHNAVSQEIVASIMQLSQSLDFKVIAEYVETIEQRNKLHELGCEQYQGYLYSKPLKIDELKQFIQKFKS